VVGGRAVWGGEVGHASKYQHKYQHRYEELRTMRMVLAKQQIHPLHLRRRVKPRLLNPQQLEDTREERLRELLMG
jgi:hypothetical protein